MTRRLILVVVLAIAAAGAGFAATRAARGPGAPADESSTAMLFGWLGVDGAKREQLQGIDPAFAADLAALRQSVRSARMNLAAALEDANSSNQLVTERVEAVIQANAEMERRVTRYLLAVRPYLSAEQQQRLFRLCAEGVRQGPGWCGRGGGGQGMGPGGGQGMGGPQMHQRGGGQGNGPGNGPGGGRGPGASLGRSFDHQG